MNAMVVFTDCRGYHGSAAPHGQSGIAARIGAVNSRAISSLAAFLRLSAQFMGDRAGRSKDLPVLHRSANPVSVAHPFSSGLAVTTPQLEQSMNKSSIDTAISTVISAHDALSLRAEYLLRINALLSSIRQISKEPHIQRLAEIGTYLHEDVAHAFECSLQDVDEALEALQGVSHE